MTFIFSIIVLVLESLNVMICSSNPIPTHNIYYGTRPDFNHTIHVKSYTVADETSMEVCRTRSICSCRQSCQGSCRVAVAIPSVSDAQVKCLKTDRDLHVSLGTPLPGAQLYYATDYEASISPAEDGMFYTVLNVTVDNIAEAKQACIDNGPSGARLAIPVGDMKWSAMLSVASYHHNVFYDITFNGTVFLYGNGDYYTMAAGVFEPGDEVIVGYSGTTPMLYPVRSYGPARGVACQANPLQILPW